jgi:hypothetical protein
VDGQDKGVTAFLTELGEGKLLGADSHWAQSLRHQEYVLYTSQAAAHQAAQEASSANRHAADQLQNSQDELGRRQAELVAVRSELQSVQRDLQTERDQHQVSRREGEQHAGEAQAERNSHRAQLGKVRRALKNRSDRVNTLEAAAVSARDRARKRFQSFQALRAQTDELLARMPAEVPSFAQVAAAGLRQTTRRTNEPDEAGDTEADPMVPDAEEREGLLQNRIICRIRYKHNAVSSCCCLQAHGFGPESAPAAQDSNPITLPDHIAHGSRLQPAGRRLVGPFARRGRWSHQSGR